jgi:Fe-S cluster biogenesis protein NfuA
VPGLATRLRSSAARRAERWLGTLGLVEPREIRISPIVTAVDAAPARPVPVAPVPVPAPVPAADDTAGPALTRAEVERVLDDLVRPALQSDGGDIELVALVGGEVHVRLVGSCGSCPSSLVTMKMGVERLLGEELTGFERLVQVD